MLKQIILGLVATSLLSCAATQVAVSKRNLDVQTKMSDSIFLESLDESPKTVYIQVRNTSDKQNITIAEELRSILSSRGYRITSSASQAHYVIQANVLQAGKMDPTAAEQALYKGYGMDGFVVGSTVAALAEVENPAHSMAFGLMGSAASIVADSMVKDVTFSIITDLQIKERLQKGKKVSTFSSHNLKQGRSGSTQTNYQSTSDFMIYQTRVLSTANKVNLDFNEALPELKKSLAQVVGGLF